MRQEGCRDRKTGHHDRLETREDSSLNVFMRSFKCPEKLTDCFYHLALVVVDISPHLLSLTIEYIVMHILCIYTIYNYNTYLITCNM